MRNCFAKIHKAVMDKIGCRPTSSDHNNFFSAISASVLEYLVVVGPHNVTWSIIIVNPLFVTYYHPVKKGFAFIT